MWFHVLACDYDGTLATAGRIATETMAALGRVRESGRRVVLVTGRQFDDLRNVCPELDFFDLVVAENGAVLYEPRARRGQTPAHPPPPALLPAPPGGGAPPSAPRPPRSPAVPPPGAAP